MFLSLMTNLLQTHMWQQNLVTDVFLLWQSINVVTNDKSSKAYCDDINCRHRKPCFSDYIFFLVTNMIFRQFKFTLHTILWRQSLVVTNSMYISGHLWRVKNSSLKHINCDKILLVTDNVVTNSLFSCSDFIISFKLNSTSSSPIWNLS